MSEPQKIPIEFLIEKLRELAARREPTPGRQIMEESADALEALGDAVDSLGSKLNRYRELTVTAPHDAGRICTICKACWANSRGAELHEEWCPSWEPPK